MGLNLILAGLMELVVRLEERAGEAVGVDKPPGYEKDWLDEERITW